MREAAAATATTTTTTPSAGTISAAAGRLTVAPEDLERFIAAVLRGCAVSERDAATTAGILARTDASGVFTHGVKCLAGYVARLRAGGLDPRANPRVEREGPAWAVVDGGAALGMVTSVMAMDLAIAKARGRRASATWACATPATFRRRGRLCHPRRRGGHDRHRHGQRQAVDDRARRAWPRPGQQSPGHRRALPRRPGAPRHGALHRGGRQDHGRALRRRAPSPPTGRWTRAESPPPIPRASWAAARSPRWAGHKGAGLALAVEVLAAVLTGAGVTEEVGAWLHDLDRPSNHGAAFLVLDIAQFLPLADFARAHGGARGRHPRRPPPRWSAARASACPVSSSRERAAAARAHGIDLPPDVADAVRALAAGSRPGARRSRLPTIRFRRSPAPTTAPSRAMP